MKLKERERRRGKVNDVEGKRMMGEKGERDNIFPVCQVSSQNEFLQLFTSFSLTIVFYFSYLLQVKSNHSLQGLFETSFM